MGHLHAGKMPQQHAVTVQRALGLAGRSGGVDHHGRIVGRGVCGGDFGLRARQERVEAEGRPVRPVRRDDEAGGAGRARLRQSRRVGDQDSRAGIGQTVADGVNAEEDGERHGDRAELVGRHMRDGHVPPLRQHDGDPVAAADARGGQRGRQPVGGLPELAVGQGFDPAVRLGLDHGRPAGLGGGPCVAAGGGDVEARRNAPAEAGDEGVIGCGGRQHDGGEPYRRRPSASMPDALVEEPSNGRCMPRTWSAAGIRLHSSTGPLAHRLEVRFKRDH